MKCSGIVVATLLATALAAACGSDSGGGGGKNSSDYVAPSPAAAEAAISDLKWNEVTLGELLSRFDVNGDDVIDAKDTSDLQNCIDKKQDLAGFHCDLVPDGKIDQQDAYALSIVLGEAIPRSPEQIKAAAKQLHDNAAGKYAPDLSPGFFDWNHDGTWSPADVGQLATLLEGDLSKYDLDGNGFVSLADAGELATDQARAEFAGAKPPTLDLDGDGVSDSKDVALLAQLSLYTSDSSFGFFDVDQDAKIDIHDFCFASDSPESESFLSLLMPAAKASAAFAADQPLYATCRADGRPVARNLTRLDTQFVVKIVPHNLYLEPVSSVPADYAPVDPSLGAGRQLFVISTNKTNRPLLSISMPQDVTLAGGNDVSFTFGGPDLPASASLVLPTSIVPLNGSQQTLALTPHPKHIVKTPLPGVLSDPAAGAKDLQAKLAAAKTEYDMLAAGCPCSLSQADRDALVRFLLQAGNCIDSTLSVAQANLKVAEFQEARLARLQEMTSSEAAAQYNLLSGDYMAVEISKTLLLISETGYDFLTGGPKQALEGAIGNLISEEAGKATSKYQPKSLTGQTAENLDASLGASAIAGTLTKMVESEGEDIGLKEFTKQFVDGVKTALEKRIKKDDPSEIEGIIKTMIKELPVYYLEYRKIVAKQSLYRARDYAKAYHDTILEVANLRRAVEEISAAKTTLAKLRKAFLDKLTSDGCPVTLAAKDPCSFDLEKAISAAQAQLAKDNAAAAKALDAAYTGAGRDSSSSECTDGQSARALQQARLHAVGAARALTQQARSNGSASALADFEKDFHDASDKERSAQTTFRSFCAVFEHTFPIGDLNNVRDAEDSSQKAADDFETAVQNALTAYNACVQSGGQSASPCAFDKLKADADPWAAASTCLGCLPSVQMNCCGDGVIESGLGEQCELDSACQSNQTCQQCKCVASGTSAPQSVIDLGGRFGIPSATITGGYTPVTITTVVHSSSSVPTKPVAGDHTTITGYYAGTVTLDQTHINGISCGAGPGASDYTICNTGNTMLVPGPAVVIIDSLAGPIPFNDTGNIYQYAFVFDADGDPTNNYVPAPAYPNDFFTGTDYWLEGDRDQTGAWSLGSKRVVSNSPMTALTSAHIFISGDAIGIAVNSSEFSASNPGFRITAFRHTGDYGLNPPYNWDGSVYPAVANGLTTLP